MPSIIAEKYKKFEPDWLAKLIAEHATKTKQVSVKKKNPENEEETITVTEDRADGVDLDKLFALAAANGIDVSKFEAQRDSHGFAGRFRMTARNMLQTVAKQRHGLKIGDEFVSAPADWLEAKKAPAEPTHTQDGAKIEKPKAAEATKEPEAAE